jgi:hypothetical protein
MNKYVSFPCKLCDVDYWWILHFIQFILENSWIQCRSPWGGQAQQNVKRMNVNFVTTKLGYIISLWIFIIQGTHWEQSELGTVLVTPGGENINPNLKTSSSSLPLPLPKVALSGPDSTHTSSWHAWNSGLVELVLAHLIGCLENLFLSSLFDWCQGQYWVQWDREQLRFLGLLRTKPFFMVSNELVHSKWKDIGTTPWPNDTSRTKWV